MSSRLFIRWLLPSILVKGTPLFCHDQITTPVGGMREGYSESWHFSNVEKLVGGRTCGASFLIAAPDKRVTKLILKGDSITTLPNIGEWDVN